MVSSIFDPYGTMKANEPLQMILVVPWNIECVDRVIIRTAKQTFWHDISFRSAHWNIIDLRLENIQDDMYE